MSLFVKATIKVDSWQGASASIRTRRMESTPLFQMRVADMICGSFVIFNRRFAPWISISGWRSCRSSFLHLLIKSQHNYNHQSEQKQELSRKAQEVHSISTWKGKGPENKEKLPGTDRFLGVFWWRLRDSIAEFASRQIHTVTASFWTGCCDMPPAYHIEVGSSPRLSESKKTPPNRVVFLTGGDYGTRTCDLMRVKHAL